MLPINSVSSLRKQLPWGLLAHDETLAIFASDQVGRVRLSIAKLDAMSVSTGEMYWYMLG